MALAVAHQQMFAPTQSKAFWVARRGYRSLKIFNENPLQLQILHSILGVILLLIRLEQGQVRFLLQPPSFTFLSCAFLYLLHWAHPFQGISNKSPVRVTLRLKKLPSASWVLSNSHNCSSAFEVPSYYYFQALFHCLITLAIGAYATTRAASCAFFPFHLLPCSALYRWLGEGHEKRTKTRCA